jgi:PAS domain S-box-containing protein
MHSTRMGSISPTSSLTHPIIPHPTPGNRIDLHPGEILRPVDVTPAEVLPPGSKKTNHRSILDHSPDIILRIGADGCLLYANPRSEEILGTKPEFLIGKNCREIGLPEAMCEFWKKLIDSTIAARTTTCREFTIQSPHGAKRYEVRACPESQDTLEAQTIIAIVRDLTRHRICESGLAEAGQRLLYHMNNSPLAVIEFDSEGQCLSWNHKAEEFFGPPKFRDGQPLTAPMPLVYPEDRERFQEAYESVANCTQMSGFVTTRFIHRNGNVLHGEWYLSGLVDENVTCRSILCFLNDVSDREQVEQALLRSKEDLEEMVLSRTTTLHRINEELEHEIMIRKHLERELVKVSEREHRRLGHDLHDGICQELAGIFYSIQAIAKRLGKSSPVQTSLHAIIQAVQRSIQHTRLLSRGLAPVELENGELSTALEQLAADTTSLFQINCEFECSEAGIKFSPEVSSNLFRIAQESIQNAIKHGKATHIRVALHFKKREGILTITDNGSGIENKNSSKGEGNGMGLTIMKHRAAIIHGTVCVNSHNGSGTSVHCVFKK